MKLTRLDIQQLPGIQPGFALDDLAPGINLVTGPNAIGKSSLIRALRYLVVEPAGADPKALSLMAEFENGGAWSVNRTGTGYTWTLDGRTTERPPLPDRDSLHCYWLTMEDLMQAGENDQRLVDQLRQALAGGYNLPALRSGDFNPRSGVGKSESKKLSQAKDEEREVEVRYQDLQWQEAELPDLEERIEKASKAETHARHLKRALELQKLVTDRQEVEAILAQFPANMGKLSGNEIERLERLEQKHEELDRERERARRAKQDAESRLQQTGLDKARPEPSQLQAQRKMLGRIKRKQDQLGDKRERLEKARIQENSALSALGGSERPPQLKPEQIDQAVSLAEKLKKNKTECVEAEARLQHVDEAPNEQVINRYGLAVQALMAWLAADEASDNKQNLGALLAGFGGLVAMVAAIFAQAWIALVGGMVAVAGALWVYFQRGDDRATHAQRDFGRQNLDGPSAWNRDAVRQTLESLQNRLDAMRLRQQRALSVRGEQERLEWFQTEREELEQQKRNLAEEIGFDPIKTELAVGHFVKLAGDYWDAVNERQTIESSIAGLEREVSQDIAGVKGFLSQWHMDSEESLPVLDANLSDLDERARKAHEEIQSIAQSDKEIERLTDDLSENEREISALYESAGADNGDRKSLENRCERLKSWKSYRQKLRDNQALESEHRRALKDWPELMEQAESGDVETLQCKLDDAEALAARRDELIRQRSDIKAHVDSAGRARDWEKAMAAVAQARTALEDRMHEQLFAEAGQFLLNEVEKEHHIEHEPEVLRDARERFRRFTHYAWDVELHDDKLMARDLKQGTLRGLEELSSGTRMQLLLAVRLAWTRRLEKNREALPLFLDEALTTSDEQRFSAVAESLADLACEEGRQVFYLSARRHELGLWEKVTGERPHHIDLAKARNVEREAGSGDYMIPESPPLPDPIGKTPEVYAAELNIPPVEPMHPVGDLHLFHLLRDDLSLLHRLMQDWNVTALGQLESLFGSRAAERAIPKGEDREKLLKRCHIAANWMNAWRKGRGKPVDRIVLEKSGAITDKFINDVSALAERHEGNGEQIVQGLHNGEVARFRSRNIEELDEYLKQEGYISIEDVLTAEERERQTLFSIGREADPEEIRMVVSWLEG